MRRELFTWLLLSVPLPYAYPHSYAIPQPLTKPDSYTYAHAHPNPHPNAHPATDSNPDTDAYTNTYATRQDSVYSIGDTGGGNVVRHRLRKLIKHIYIFSTHIHVFRMSQRYNLHWRDGVYLWRRALCRELFAWLLLRVSVFAA